MASVMAACLALGSFLPTAATAQVSPDEAATSCAIERPHKFGVGAWQVQGGARMAADLSLLAPAWYYDWQADMGSGARYVPMIWSAREVALAASAPGDVLLGFNEPDNFDQSNMSVEEALDHWPELMATGKRLGSPATTTGNELGERSWLGRFMAAVEERGYRVDFIALHYYPTDPSIAAFRDYLEAIHHAYGLPLWVTEWSLADWNDGQRFTPAEQAAFLREAVEMLDDLPYVERHAWFGLYEGMDGWHIGSGLVAEGGRTEVGEAFLGAVTCPAGRADQGAAAARD